MNARKKRCLFFLHFFFFEFNKKGACKHQIEESQRKKKRKKVQLQRLPAYEGDSGASGMRMPALRDLGEVLRAKPRQAELNDRCQRSLSYSPPRAVPGCKTLMRDKRHTSKTRMSGGGREVVSRVSRALPTRNDTDHEVDM